jgi:hypothetical protein
MIKSRNIDCDAPFTNNTYGFMPFGINPKTATVTARTADTTLTAANFNAITTNAGDSGAQVLTLPAALTTKGMALRVVTLAAFTITLTPATGEKIWLNGSGVASKYAITAGVIGDFLELYSDGTDYIITNYSGVVTKEA